MRRTLLLTAGTVFVIAAVGWMLFRTPTTTADQPRAKGQEEGPKNTPLSIGQVVLFSSGVAHFSRSAEVEGDARIDLTFPEQDINDLIKSMVLQDFSEKGRISAVTYDSHEPIGKPAPKDQNPPNPPPMYARRK